MRRGREERPGTPKPGVCIVTLRQVELELLLKTRARVALAEGLVLGPFLGELLGETALRRNGPGPSGRVLRAGRHRGQVSPLECLVEVVELREDEFAVAVVLGLWAEAAGCRLRCRLRRTAALVVLLPAGTLEEPVTLAPCFPWAGIWNPPRAADRSCVCVYVCV